MNKGLYPNPTHPYGYFESGLFAIPSSFGGLVADIRHGLNCVPNRVRWVLVCQKAEGGFQPGAEQDVTAFNGNQVPAFGWGVDNANVWLHIQTASASCSTIRRDTFIAFSITAANWKAKCYVEAISKT